MKEGYPGGVATRMGCCVGVVLACFALKSYYSSADSQDLFWILAPTAYLVQMFSGLEFVNEPGLGWFNQPFEVVIAPSCAGVNFLIMVFCMSAFQVIFSQADGFRRIIRVGLAGCGAYVVTLLVNSVRIWLSVLLFRADISADWLSPGAVHRIMGVTLYYVVLCFYYLLVSSMLKRGEAPTRMVGSAGGWLGQVTILSIPLTWYLLFVVGIPFANNAYRLQPERFIEHSLAVGVTATVLTLIVTLGILSSRGLVHLFQAGFGGDRSRQRNA